MNDQMCHDTINTVIHGDSLDVLRALEANSIDSLVADPPAGINFMNRDFDKDRGGRAQWVAWLTEIMTEAYRVLKPGAHGLVWALPRTSHWTACALEDAGFSVRNKFYHLFGSGFPKSYNVFKSIKDAEYNCTDGLGTDVKPACEEWILIRKPLSESTVAKNVLRWGTGALNIDASRVGSEVGLQRPPRRGIGVVGGWANHVQSPGLHGSYDGQGRFPAHLLLSHSILCTESACDMSCPVQEMDRQSGHLKSGGRVSHKGDRYRNNVVYSGEIIKSEYSRKASEGGASRYFQQFQPTEDDYVPFLYAAKASRRERNAGCEALPITINAAYGNFAGDGRGRQTEHTPESNNHPTVKSQKLMSYLIKLTTPENGIVLDPFAGSGSTLVAAINSNYRFLGIEKEEEYITIARARIAHAYENLPPQHPHCKSSIQSA